MEKRWTMGNSALRDLAVINDKALSEYSGHVAVDAHHWLYKYITGTTRYIDPDRYTTEDGTEVANLIALYRGLPTLLRSDLTPVFIFDGEAHDLKEDTIEDRREVKQEAKQKMKQAEKEGDTEAIRRYKSQTHSLNKTIQQTSRKFLDAVGVPYLEAGGSGEGYASLLTQAGITDYVMTDDYDSLLFGAPITIRQYSGSGPTEEMDLEKTLDKYSIRQEDLIDIALLCGTDFNDGVRGIGPKRAVQKISGGKSASEVAENKGTSIPGLEELRSLFLEPDLNDLPSTKPNRKKPDFEALRDLSETWEIPTSTIEDNIIRFPRY